MLKLQAQNFESIATNGGADYHRGALTVTDWLHYDNGVNANALGSRSSAHTLGAYIKLTPSLLAGHVNRQVEELKFFMNDLAFTGDLTIKILTSTTAAPVYTQIIPHASVVQGWNTITLTTPYQIDGTEFYIGYEYHMPASHYGAGIDAGPVVANGNYLTWNGTWHELSAAGINANLNLQAGIGGATATNDCGVSNITQLGIITPSNQTISGELTNYGSTTLTSIDINYAVDGGAIVTQTLSGLNIATGQSHSFDFTTQWTATVGNHTVEVSISNFNGNGADDVAQNNQRQMLVKVASNSTQNIPLYEEFTASTCNPCASFNGNSFNNTFLTNNAGHYNLIKYQMNWPGSGDPYYTAEGGVRKNLYHVGGVPTLFLDGSAGPNYYQHPSELQPYLDVAYAAPTYFSLLSSYEINASHDISVQVVVTPYLAGDYTIFCAVVEKTTTGNVGSNGETSFTNVMMKMVPNAYGTPITTNPDAPQTININASLSGTHVEQWTDLEVVVFIQDMNNKVVYQSTKSVERTANVENTVFKNVKLYPNPSTGIIKISNALGMKVEVINTLGDIIYSKDNFSATETIDLSNLPNGMYFAKLTSNDKVGLRKIIISK